MDAQTSIIEVFKRKYSELSLNDLDRKGLGRWDEEYYLFGLYHPLRAMLPSESKDFRLQRYLSGELNQSSANVDVYIHIPFCHSNCSFCHFYKEIIPQKHSGLEEDYVKSLLQEIKNYTSLYGQKIKPRSIQFGGGTPSALSFNALCMLLTYLQDSFDMSHCVEVKFEFHPNMIQNLTDYRDKLQVLKNFGLTTAIIDLEATDSTVLKSIRRGNSSLDGYKQLINIAREHGIQSVASAFITGLPHETVETFYKTIESLCLIEGIDAVNIYPLMFKPSDSIFYLRRTNTNIFCSRDNKDLMLLIAKELLAKAGFNERPSHFFTKNFHLPYQQFAKAESKTLLGFGPSSFGYLNGSKSGLQYMNYPDLKRYSTAVKEGKTGIWRGSILNEGQTALRELMFALNSFEPVSTELLDRAIKFSHTGRLNNVVEAMIQLNLIEIGLQTIQLSARGQFRNAEILFYLSEQEKTLWNYNDSEFVDLRRYDYFPNISYDNQTMFECYLKSIRQGVAA